MILVVGLGNPGEEYEGTRHNVGFRVVDLLATAARTDIRRRDFRALTATARICRSEVLLIKPQTYMNRSGQSVAAAMRSLRIRPEDVVVVYDELDLPVGQVRIRKGGGTGGHNGVDSVIRETGHAGFVRVRVGIGKPARRGAGADHVLEPFLPEELETMEQAVQTAADGTREIICRDVSVAMNRFNRKAKPEASEAASDASSNNNTTSQS